MADVTIGGQTYSVDLPNFKKLKAAWKHIALVQGSTDPMESVDGVLGVISVGSTAEVTVEELENALKPTEIPGLRPFINQLMIELGLAKPPEEAADPLAPAPESLSTATSEPLSTSSTQLGVEG